MAIYDELPVYKATYDLLLEMFRFSKDFSKEYKYTVGRQTCIKKFIYSLTQFAFRNAFSDKGFKLGGHVSGEFGRQIFAI